MTDPTNTPDALVTVPVEPTVAMLSAARAIIPDAAVLAVPNGWPGLVAIYQAMLAARPASPPALGSDDAIGPESFSAEGRFFVALDHLTRMTWRWGESCGIDDVSWDDTGDSYNETCRDDHRKARRAVVEAFHESVAEKVAALQARPPASVGGDYTCALAPQQEFERHPELAAHIERMAVHANVGSMKEWGGFLDALNAALAPARRVEGELTSLIEERIGQEFDGECRLTEVEARQVIDALGSGNGQSRLRKAAKQVLDGLNARIDSAPKDAVPVFVGIADLHSALHDAGEPGQPVTDGGA